VELDARFGNLCRGNHLYPDSIRPSESLTRQQVEQYVSKPAKRSQTDNTLPLTETSFCSPTRKGKTVKPYLHLFKQLQHLPQGHPPSHARVRHLPVRDQIRGGARVAHPLQQSACPLVVPSVGQDAHECVVGKLVLFETRLCNLLKELDGKGGAGGAFLRREKRNPQTFGRCGLRKDRMSAGEPLVFSWQASTLCHSFSSREMGSTSALSDEISYSSLGSKVDGQSGPGDELHSRNNRVNR
jgi:hypothetical protein